MCATLLNLDDESFSAALSINDTPERTGHQSAIVVPAKARGVLPVVDVGRPVELTLIDPSGGRWQAGLRAFEKGEVHLTRTDPLLREHNVRPGDIIHVRRRSTDTFYVSFRQGGSGDRGTLDGILRPQRTFPDEVAPGAGAPEGALARVTVNRYERSAVNRQACLDAHGHACKVCDLDFEQKYGKLGRGFIHVHHLVPVSALTPGYRVDPVRELLPVCPNCHAMLHRDDPPLDPVRLRSLVKGHPTTP